MTTPNTQMCYFQFSLELNWALYKKIWVFSLFKHRSRYGNSTFSSRIRFQKTFSDPLFQRIDQALCFCFVSIKSDGTDEQRKRITYDCTSIVYFFAPTI